MTSPDFSRPFPWWKYNSRTSSPSKKSHPSRNFVTSYNSDLRSGLSSAKPRIPRPRTGVCNGRPTTARPRTGMSTVNGQDIICGLTESRGVNPVVGMAILNLDTCSVILSQILDDPSYGKTIQTLSVFEPQVIVVPGFENNLSKLHSLIEQAYGDTSTLQPVHRQYFTEVSGLELMHQFAIAEDFEVIKSSVSVSYFALCCFSAVIKYVDNELSTSFAPQSLRVTYTSTEESMMIDESTRSSLELIRNLENPKSKVCLFGLLDRTETPMGARYLRSTILRPSASRERIVSRLNAVAELSSNEQAFHAVKTALKKFVDAEKVLTHLILTPKNPKLPYKEQSVNRLIILKTFIESVPPVFRAMLGLTSELLVFLRESCNPENLEPIMQLINSAINPESIYSKSSVELRKQRIFAVKDGIDAFLDIFRQAYIEAQEDIQNHGRRLQETYNISVEVKFDKKRWFYFRIPSIDCDRQSLPNVFTNVVKVKGYWQCQTITLIKLNQKMKDCEGEVLAKSEEPINQLTERVREYMSALLKCCEAVTTLDMLMSFADVATSENYVLPHISSTLALKQCRHPIREKYQYQKFVPNDIYATQQTRFQIVTGANMSGKSTYLRTVVFATIMMQMGSFVPASHASLPIMSRVFARTSIDDSLEANVSTFALEMREMAFILRNIDSKSLVIVDELGRGTSPRDGLGIAIAISEAFINSKALVWFATHFKELVNILSNRPGVLPLHMSVSTNADTNTMTMLYQISQGAVPNNHYGLAFAKLFPLPRNVLSVAKTVATAFDAKARQNRSKSGTLKRLKKRKLLLKLKEQLEQALESTLEGEHLRLWLMELQKEFVNRMVALDEDKNE